LKVSMAILATTVQSMPLADNVTLQSRSGAPCTWRLGIMVVCPLQAASDQHPLCHQNLCIGQGETVWNGSLMSTCSNEDVLGVTPCGSPTGAKGVVLTMEEAECRHGNNHGQQLMPPNDARACKKAQQTLLVSYLPRTATEYDLQSAFATAGISECCFVSIMREGNTSKCFGFVRFPSCDEAQAAMLACTNVEIVLKDHASKASWARSEFKDVKKVERQSNHAHAKANETQFRQELLDAYGHV